MLNTDRTPMGPAHASGATQRSESRWLPQVLDFIDGHTADIVAELSDLVAHPSVSGTDAENSIQSDMADRLDQLGLDVDHWQIPLAQTLAAPDFPGVEVDRREAWGLVGVAHGQERDPP